MRTTFVPLPKESSKASAAAATTASSVIKSTSSLNQVQQSAPAQTSGQEILGQIEEADRAFRNFCFGVVRQRRSPATSSRGQEEDGIRIGGDDGLYQYRLPFL